MHVFSQLFKFSMNQNFSKTIDVMQNKKKVYSNRNIRDQNTHRMLCFLHLKVCICLIEIDF